MPVLKNAKHEYFAQERAKGVCQDTAYVNAGFKKNSSNAARLNANERILSRIEEILSRSAKRAEKSLADVIAEMTKLGFSNMANYVNVDDEGRALVDLSEVNPDDWAAVSEVTVDEQLIAGKTDKDGKEIKPTILNRKTKLKLHDKKGALHLMGKHLGGFVDKGLAEQANMPAKIEITFVEPKS